MAVHGTKGTVPRAENKQQIQYIKYTNTHTHTHMFFDLVIEGSLFSHCLEFCVFLVLEMFASVMYV